MTKAAAMYVLRVRQPDGSWEFDLESPMTKRDAEYEAKRNRILLGVLCQVWKESEAVSVSESSQVGESKP
jgi:hypothetical protein